MTRPKRMDLPGRLPPRGRNEHKGDFGRVLILAGSRNMAGAAALAALGALRGGAGLVTVACGSAAATAVNVHAPSAMTAVLPQDDRGSLSVKGLRELLSWAAEADVVALGPGLGRARGTAELVTGFLADWQGPLVLDADGLNLCAGRPEFYAGRTPPAILTPHPGEMARLTGRSTADIQSDRAAAARDFAAQHGVIAVLKGAGTVVADGKRLYVNHIGNPGMATGGTGDVLTGTAAALLARFLKVGSDKPGLAPFDAACLAVWVHGRAGDLAAASLGQTALTAMDVANYLGPAFLERGG